MSSSQRGQQAVDRFAYESAKATGLLRSHRVPRHQAISEFNGQAQKRSVTTSQLDTHLGIEPLGQPVGDANQPKRTRAQST